MEKFSRYIKFVIDFDDGGQVEFDERFNIKFNVSKFFSTGIDGLNTAEVSITNLGNKTRKRIEQAAGVNINNQNTKAATLSLYAGYKSYDLIFKGKIQNVEKEDLQPEINTIIYCYDNSINSNISRSIVSQPVSVFLGEIAAQIGLPISIDPTINRNIVNTAYTGSIAAILQELAEDFDFNYYVDDGTLFITKNDFFQNTIKTVDRTNGLIGKPEINSTGCRFSMLLTNEVSIGDFIQINADTGNFNIGDKTFVAGRLQGTEFNAFDRDFSELNGQYYIREINHIGESRGDNFVSQLTCLYPTVKVD